MPIGIRKSCTYSAGVASRLCLWQVRMISGVSYLSEDATLDHLKELYGPQFIDVTDQYTGRQILRDVKGAYKVLTMRCNYIVLIKKSLPKPVEVLA